MSQSKLVKDRTCRACNQVLQMTASQLKEHATMCARLNAIGMVTPSIVKPSLKDIQGHYD